MHTCQHSHLKFQDITEPKCPLFSGQSREFMVVGKYVNVGVHPELTLAFWLVLILLQCIKD